MVVKRFVINAFEHKSTIHANLGKILEKDMEKQKKLAISVNMPIFAWLLAL